MHPLHAAEVFKLIDALILSIETAEKKLQLLPETQNIFSNNKNTTTCNPPVKKQQQTQL